MSGKNMVPTQWGGTLTALKAIRLKCLDCATTAHEVRLCPCGPEEHPEPCPLYHYRFGRRPAVKTEGEAAGVPGEEQAA